MNYWQKRLIDEQNTITNKTQAQIDAKLAKYYSRVMRDTIDDFEALYNKYLSILGDDKEPSPAVLYNMDKYYRVQAQCRERLLELGKRQEALFSKSFEQQWKEIYDSLDLPVSGKSYATISSTGAKEFIKQIWCSDGRHYSDRIWNNTQRLMERLENQLIDCVVAGRSSKELKKTLVEEFGVSYRRADTIVRTETAHIQTQAAAQRYIDSGLEYYEFLADTDEKTCSECGELDGQKFRFSEMAIGINAPPIHPNDRCCIIPVIGQNK